MDAWKQDGENGRRSPWPWAAAAGAVGLMVLSPIPATGDAGKGLRWKEPVEIASGNAYRGPWRMNESNFDFVDDPAVAVEGEDLIGIVWADHSGQDIYFQSFNAGGEPRIEEAVNISCSPDIFSWLPRAVFADADTVLVVWQEIVFSGGSHGGEIFFAHSGDGGDRFSEPENLSNTTAGAAKGRLTRDMWDNGSLDIATGPGDDVYVAWTEYEGALRFRRSEDGGRNFSEAVEIVPEKAGTPARGPSIAVSPDGEVFLAWAVGEDSAADIYVARSDDRGRSFGEARSVNASDGHSDAPSIALDGDGVLHVAYGESPRGIRQQYHLRYARSRDGGETFEDSRQIVSHDAHGGYAVHYPRLAVSGNGRVYLNWEHFPEPFPRPRGLGMRYSVDGGETFADPALVDGTDDPALGFSGSQQGLLMRKLAVDAAGNPVVVNSTFREGTGSRIWLHRGRSGEEDFDWDDIKHDLRAR